MAGPLANGVVGRLRTSRRTLCRRRTSAGPSARGFTAVRDSFVRPVVMVQRANIWCELVLVVAAAAKKRPREREEP